MKEISVLILDNIKENTDLFEVCLKRQTNFISNVYRASNLESAKDICFLNAPEILILDFELGNNKPFFLLLKSFLTYKPEIIFNTNTKYFAVDVLNYIQPIVFLIKPIKSVDFNKALDKAIDSIKSRYLSKSLNTYEYNNYLKLIAIPSVNKIEIINQKDIVYLEADGRYTIFHLVKGNYKIASKNLGEYERQLDPNSFFRIHNSYIVNLNMITCINKSSGNYCELTNYKPLPIAKRRQEKLNKFLRIK